MESELTDTSVVFTHTPTSTRVEVSLYLDTDVTPFEYECYSNEDIVAWRHNRWQFVMVEVTIFCHDACVGQDTLSGVEHGDPSDDVHWNALDPRHGSVSDTIGVALAHARELSELFRCAPDGHLPLGLGAVSEWLGGLA